VAASRAINPIAGPMFIDSHPRGCRRVPTHQPAGRISPTLSPAHLAGEAAIGEAGVWPTLSSSALGGSRPDAWVGGSAEPAEHDQGSHQGRTALESEKPDEVQAPELSQSLDRVLIPGGLQTYIR
jgi:hypothetical protein